MIRKTIILITFCLLHQFASAQNPSITGNVWIDDDQNNAYNGEIGIAEVKVYLKNATTDEIVDSTITSQFAYIFPSDMSITLQPGDYYLEIPTSEFNSGELDGFISCEGSNDADDGVDNDDNGSDAFPLTTTSFTLGTVDIDYVDLCFKTICSFENPLASFSCEAISNLDIFCEVQNFATFCSTLPSGGPFGNQPEPLCPDGGSASNISWFGFVAAAGSYEIVLNPNYCTGSTTGNEGMEMGIYRDCSFSDAVFCSPSCSPDPISVESSLLVPGETYYLFINGCNGTVCDYTMDITGNPLPVNLAPDDVCFVQTGTVICEEIEVSQFSGVTLEAVGIDVDAEYVWEISTISGNPYQGPPSTTTNINTFLFIAENMGEYAICLTSIDNGCSAWVGELCRTITVTEIVPFGAQACNQIEEEDIYCGVSSLHNLVGLMYFEDSPGPSRW